MATATRPPAQEVEPVDEMTVTMRAALVAFLLTRGACLSTAEVAQRTGLTREGAWYLMCKMSLVIPIGLKEGRWHVVTG